MATTASVPVAKATTITVSATFEFGNMFSANIDLSQFMSNVQGGSYVAPPTITTPPTQNLTPQVSSSSQNAGLTALPAGTFDPSSVLAMWAKGETPDLSSLTAQDQTALSAAIVGAIHPNAGEMFEAVQCGGCNFLMSLPQGF